MSGPSVRKLWPKRNKWPRLVRRWRLETLHSTLHETEGSANFACATPGGHGEDRSSRQIAMPGVESPTQVTRDLGSPVHNPVLNLQNKPTIQSSYKKRRTRTQSPASGSLLAQVEGSRPPNQRWPDSDIS